METKEIEFSIIVPIFNSENYIKETIESVQKQTYDSWELILIDDGSTDKSGTICEEYLSDCRIKVFHFKNSGEAMSRIRGIRIAKGKYLLALDSDDFLDIDCLEQIKKAIDLSGCDMILFGWRLFGKTEKDVKFPLEPQKIYNRVELIEAVIKFTNHGLVNKAVRTQLAQAAIPNMVTRNLSLNADYAQIIPILCNIENGYVMDDILYNYRIYDTSLSHNFSIQHIIDTDFVTEAVIQLLQRCNMLQKEIEDAVYVSYCKMISRRLIRLLIERKITSKERKEIHELYIYQKTGEFEKLKYFSLEEAIVLKLFRSKQYWILCIYSYMKHFTEKLRRKNVNENL